MIECHPSSSWRNEQTFDAILPPPPAITSDQFAAYMDAQESARQSEPREN